MLRIPHCLDNGLTDGGKVVSPTHQPHFTPQKHYYYHHHHQHHEIVIITEKSWPDLGLATGDSNVRTLESTKTKTVEYHGLNESQICTRINT
jgi:hypothetical protein